MRCPKSIRMQRDMDLVRELLLKLEAIDHRPGAVLSFGADDPAIAIEGRAPDVIAYHLSLIYEAGFVETGTQGSGQTMSRQFMFRRLSWSGHEFLDTVRDPEVWRRTKAGMTQAGGWTIGLIKDMATAYAKHVAKERLGLDL
jgi:Hypothetical protein (DUF2513)